MIFGDCFVYDGSFTGLLCAVFEAIWRGRLPEVIYRYDARTDNLFAFEGISIVTDCWKAARVRGRLRHRLSRPMLEMIYEAYSFHSDNIDYSLLRFMFKVIVSPSDVSSDFSNVDLADLLRYSRMAKRA